MTAVCVEAPTAYSAEFRLGAALDPVFPEIEFQPEHLEEHGNELVAVSSARIITEFPDDSTVAGHLEGSSGVRLGD